MRPERGSRRGPARRLPSRARRSRSRCSPACSPGRSASARADRARRRRGADRPAHDRLVQRPRSTWTATARSAARTSRWSTAGSPSGPSASPARSRWSRRSRCRWPAAGWPARSTWSASPPAGPTTSASRRRRGRGCRTPSRSAGCRCSSPWPTTPTRCPRCGCRWPARCSASARTSSTCCPTSPTTRPPASAGLPHRLGARWSQVVAAAVLVAAAVVIVVGAPVDTAVARSSRCVVTAGARRRRAARARPGAVPGRDRDRAGRRRHAGVGADDRAWDLVVVGAGPAGAATALGALHADPSLRVLLLDRVRLPARQVLRRRHRAARLRTLASIGVTGVEDGWTPLHPARARPRRPVGRRHDGPAGLGHPARGLRRPAGRAGRATAAPPLRTGSRDRVDRATGDARRHAGAVVVGADGAHSVVRAAPRAAVRPPGPGHPRLRPDAAGPARHPGDPVRRPPAAGVRLGLRPRRRALQRRVRRAAPRPPATATRPRGRCCSTSSSSCCPAGRPRAQHWKGHHLPLSGWRWDQPAAGCCSSATRPGWSTR